MKSTGLILSCLAVLASVSCGEVSVSINDTPNAIQWVKGNSRTRVTINYKSESIFGKLKSANNDLKVYAVCYGSRNTTPSKEELQSAAYVIRENAFQYVGDVPCDNQHMKALQLCVVKPPALGGLFSRKNAQLEIVPRRCSGTIQIKQSGLRFPSPQGTPVYGRGDSIPGGQSMRAAIPPIGTADSPDDTLDASWGQESIPGGISKRLSNEYPNFDTGLEGGPEEPSGRQGSIPGGASMRVGGTPIISDQEEVRDQQDRRAWDAPSRRGAATQTDMSVDASTDPFHDMSSDTDDEQLPVSASRPVLPQASGRFRRIGDSIYGNPGSQLRSIPEDSSARW